MFNQHVRLSQEIPGLYRVDNNIFWVWQANAWPYKGMTLSKHNIYRGSRINAKNHLAHCMRDSDASFVQNPAMPKEPTVLPFKGFGSLQQAATQHIDFRLADNSPAIDAGSTNNDEGYGHNSKGKSADLGAIEHGTEWVFPRPGPRWMNDQEAMGTTALPAELNPAMLGFTR